MLHPFEIDGRTFWINRSKQVLPALDLMGWLKSTVFYPKVFWKDREEQITRAAVGNLFSFPCIPRFSGILPFELRLYGGIRFSENTHCDDLTWRGFPKTCFWLPRIELSQIDETTEAIFYSFDKESEEIEIKPSSLYPDRGIHPSKTFALIDRLERPTFNLWKDNIHTALNLISKGELHKIVFARKTTLQFSKPPCIWSCLNHLMHQAKQATLFAFQLSPSLCFLGATPEKLFKRDGPSLSTEVLAGTRPRGITSDEELQWEQELLNSVKDCHEFHIVKDILQTLISPLSKELKWEGRDRILKTGHVQHLYNRLNVLLQNDVLDKELIDALHPTPALGGFPREKALTLIRQMEPFDRGWYGGPIGVISPKGANLHVAIRSALIRECALHLFAGAGIVQGSTAEQEWEELEQKIRPFAEGANLFF
jgi:menaquinone-specific isochorismate synthase